MFILLCYCNTITVYYKVTRISILTIITINVFSGVFNFNIVKSYIYVMYILAVHEVYDVYKIPYFT